MDTVFQDPDSAARAASEMEIEVPAPSPGTRSPVGARAPRSTPRTIKHTPAFSTQGSVFERQMSAPSDEDSLLNSELGVDHTLYDIPEESAEDSGNDNGGLLRPEIVVRERPVKKGMEEEIQINERERERERETDRQTDRQTESQRERAFGS